MRYILMQYEGIAWTTDLMRTSLPSVESLALPRTYFILDSIFDEAKGSFPVSTNQRWEAKIFSCS